MTHKYKRFIRDLDKEDHEGRTERMRPITEELAQRGLDPQLQTDPVARMKAVLNHLRVFVSDSR